MDTELEYDAALKYMQGLVRFGWKLDNERIAALCARMGDPQDKYKVVHIAGTKGKGSTTALTAAILHESGFRVGSYFSPYVYDVRERIQVDGCLVTRGEFAKLVTLALPEIEAISATDAGQTTEFELKSFIGFLHFARQQVQYACIEVGIGGRLDATNIVNPSITVITNIGLDHTQILGDTHELIAAEKAGIIKPGIPCITATEHAGALEVIASVADQLKSPLTLVRRGSAMAPTGSASQVHWQSEPPSRNAVSEHNSAFRIATGSRSYYIPRMAMRGLHQRINAACAVAAAESALNTAVNEGDNGLTESAVQCALATTALPGRLTVLPLTNGRLAVMDGAHNELAADSLCGPLEDLKKEYDIRRTIVVLGMLSGHDPRAVARAIVPGSQMVFACSPAWKRALPADELANSIRGLNSNVEVIPNVRDAVRAALAESTFGDMVLITGSFYTVGEVSTEWILRVSEETG